MKKLVLLFVAALMTGALVTTGGPATAAYPGTLRTHTVVAAHDIYKHSPSHHRRTVFVHVKVTTAGNAAPKHGALKIKVFRVHPNGTLHRVRSKTIAYHGGNQRVRLGKFFNGRFRVRVSFVAKAGTVFKNSQGSDHYKVKTQS